MKTYLSVTEAEKKGIFQTVGCSQHTRLYNLVQNKGFKLLGRPSLKQKFDSPIIEVCGDTFDMSASKDKTYLQVEISIID